MQDLRDSFEKVANKKTFFKQKDNLKEKTWQLVPD
jgi:hypothetical protein